jgi:hypothetical protein
MITFEMWEITVLLLIWFAGGATFGAVLAVVLSELVDREDHENPPGGLL